MFIYNGKFNWLGHQAANETITIVFPAGFALNDPVAACWQWTTDAMVHKKASVANSGVVHSLTKAGDYCRIYFSFGFYNFNATITPDFKTLTAEMHNPRGDKSGPMILSAMRISPTNLAPVAVFIGTLDYLTLAQSEMVTVVIPNGVDEGAFVGLYFEWTVDGSRVQKANHPVNATFKNVKHVEGESITASIIDGSNYTYNFTFTSKTSGSFIMSKPGEGKSAVVKLTRAYGQ